MTISLPGKTDTFEVVVSFDSALDMTVDEFKEYTATMDKNLLKFKEGEQPTLFVMRKVIPFHTQKKVDNEKVAVKEGNMSLQISYTSEEVRASLIDIINPPYVPEDKQIKFRRGKDGLASEDLMEILMTGGVAEQLFAARQVLVGNPVSALKKK